MKKKIENLIKKQKEKKNQTDDERSRDSLCYHLFESGFC